MADLWHQLAVLVLRLVERYDAPGLALVLLIEEAGLPLPVPGDVLMLLAGYRISLGAMPLVRTILLLELATIVGASVLYWLGARGGRPTLYRFGGHVGFNRARLDRAGSWLRRRGARAVFLGRITPGLRIITPLAAGAFGIPYRTFLPALALGSLVYITALVLAGMWLGQPAIEAIEGLHLSFRLLATLVLSAGLAWTLLMLRRRATEQAPPAGRADAETVALAGLLATLEMGLAVNVALYALSGAGLLLPRQTLLEFLWQASLRVPSGEAIQIGLLTLVLVLLGNLLGAAIYAWVVEPRLAGPAWWRGLVFSLLPAAVSVFGLLPALGAGPLGLELGAGILPLVGELMRNAVFGAGLGVSYALLRDARAASSEP